jgi:outer membrane protein OmpA-like peptidoglycan-associated protein
MSSNHAPCDGAADRWMGAMFINRRQAIRFAVAAIAFGPTLLAGAAISLAAEKPSAAQIIDALKSPQGGPLKRSLLGPSAPPANALSGRDEQLFNNALSRKITIEERKELATIASSKREINLVVNFDYASADIRPDAGEVLASLGAALASPELKGSKVMVAGHTDAHGSDTYNMDLSQRRAHAVRGFLISTFKIAPETIVAVGFGEERLKNTADPYSSENRRVQVVNMSAAK